MSLAKSGLPPLPVDIPADVSNRIFSSRRASQESLSLCGVTCCTTQASMVRQVRKQKANDQRKATPSSLELGDAKNAGVFGDGGLKAGYVPLQPTFSHIHVLHALRLSSERIRSLYSLEMLSSTPIDCSLILFSAFWVRRDNA